MPRTYKRKPGARLYRDYSDEHLQNAMRECEAAGMATKNISKFYKIPIRTLRNKLRQRHTKTAGGQAVLNNVEESAVKRYCLLCAEYGMPLDTNDVQVIVKSYLDKMGKEIKPFKNNVPGRDWCLKFLKRHKKEISARRCQNLKRSKGEVKREVFEQYFDNLEETLDNVDPHNIINYDETNLADDPGTKKCIFKRGVKYPERIINHSRGNVTVMFAGCADGTLLPPYVIYKSKELYECWCEGGPVGTRYNRTKSGWIDHVVFQDWFFKIVVPWARRSEGRKVVIGDNLSSHLNIDVLQMCERLGIRFALLPPNTTDKTQPLDVAFFRPLKVHWRKILESYKLKYPSSTGLSKQHFPHLLKKLMTCKELNEKKVLQSGFRACGIWPLNREEVLKKLPQVPRNGDDEQEVATVNRVVSDAVLELLQKFKYNPRGEEVVRQKRRKVSVEPGKSISADEIQNPQPVPGPSDVGAGPSDVGAGPSEVASSHDEQEESSSSDSEEDQDTLTLYENGDLPEQPKKTDFVLTELKKNVYYVAKVLSEEDEDGDLEVRYLRKSSKLVDTFVYPNVEDTSPCSIDLIRAKLPHPTVGSTRRLSNCFKFPIDLSGLNIR